MKKLTDYHRRVLGIDKKGLRKWTEKIRSGRCIISSKVG